MKPTYQILYKGMYTNKINVLNYHSIEAFMEQLETITTNKYLQLITTNICIE